MEEWKDVVGYEGLYEVSNLGNVRGVDRIVQYKNSYKTIKGKVKTPRYYPDGYTSVILSKDGYKKQYFVHRLVAYAFIPNPDNLPCINHINEIPDDNRVENLEWCTIQYNNTYGTRIKREIETKIKNGKYNPKHIGLPYKELQRLWYIEKREKILATARRKSARKKVKEILSQGREVSLW